MWILLQWRKTCAAIRHTTHNKRIYWNSTILKIKSSTKITKISKNPRIMQINSMIHEISKMHTYSYFNHDVLMHYFKTKKFLFMNSDHYWRSLSKNTGVVNHKKNVLLSPCHHSNQRLSKVLNYSTTSPYTRWNTRVYQFSALRFWIQLSYFRAASLQLLSLSKNLDLFDYQFY
jgi:hypothetical protein